MNNKISLQDLAQGLAKRKKMTRKDAESFIHKVFEVIEERVMADGTVKVKGLGTFKINTVDSRESVNVATGERIVIDTHSRISFTPHPALRDAVNRPFSDFETVVISDDVKTEDMEYVPASDKPVEETSVPIEAASDPVAEELPTEDTSVPEPEPKSVAEDATAPIVEEQTPEPVAEPEPELDLGKTETNSEPTTEEPTVPSHEATAQSKSSSKTGIIIGVLAVVVLCILFFVFWHPNKQEKGESATVTEQTVATQEESATEEEVTSEEPAATKEQSAAAAVQETLTPEEAAEKYPQVEGGEYLIVGTKEEYTLQKGDDLFKLSVGVYGDKKFAPYIIVYNDIKDPSHIEIGDVLKLPELRKRE